MSAHDEGLVAAAAEIKALEARIQAASDALEAPLAIGVSTMRSIDLKWLAVRAALHPKED